MWSQYAADNINIDYIKQLLPYNKISKTLSILNRDTYLS